MTLDFLLRVSGSDFFCFVVYLALEDKAALRLLLRVGTEAEGLEEEDDEDDELGMMDLVTQ